MKIAFLSHPFFLGHQSMPRYLYMLANGMKKRGHDVEILVPDEFTARLTKIRSLKKWLGYIDQFIIFPRRLVNRAKQLPSDTLFVFTDHALGPWVPFVSDRIHVIHCHDFLAQKAALHHIKNLSISWTGRMYQSYIRRGYSTGSNFISVSLHTQHDLHAFLGRTPEISAVVYNGLDQKFTHQDTSVSRNYIGKEMGLNTTKGFILHVGGNQWYKNRPGVVEVYTAYRNQMASVPIPLILVGESPNRELLLAVEKSPFASDIRFATGKGDDFLVMAYSGAVALLFPSIAEGFGWPIGESMACGCPVVTTGEPPMTEVGGDVAHYIGRMPLNADQRQEWAQAAAETLAQVVNLSETARAMLVEKGYENVKRFKEEFAIEQIEKIYQSIVDNRLK